MIRVMVFVSALPNTLKTYANIITVEILTGTNGTIHIQEYYNDDRHGRYTVYRTE